MHKNILKLCLYTEANSELGFGHLNRCLILGGALISAGHQVTLIARGNESEIRGFSGDRCWVKNVQNRPKNWPNADAFIVDCYCYDEFFYAALRKFYNLIIIFDDEHKNLPKNISAVINANMYADPTRYAPGLKKFIGISYLLVRDEFYGLNSYLDANDVLICVGGSDPTEQMDRLIGLAIRSTERRIHVVYGHSHINLDVVQKWKRHARVVTYQASTAMTEIYKHCAYAITGSGSMIYELGCLGIPSISMALSENQVDLGLCIAEKKLGFYLGEYLNVLDCDISRAIQVIDEDIILRENIRTFWKELLKEKGSQHLAKKISEWIILRQDPSKTPYSADEVRLEYDDAAKQDGDHSKQKWGSRESMLNRYALAMRTLPFSNETNWLDVGCGLGILQSLVIDRFPKIKGIAIELSHTLISLAINKKIPNIEFIETDFMGYSGGKVRILTCIGVLSKSNIDLPSFIKQAGNLLDVNGLLFADFTNQDWNKFNKKDFFPETRHLWFSGDYVKKLFIESDLFEIEECKGYDPKGDVVTNIEDSHTFYILVRRTANQINRI